MAKVLTVATNVRCIHNFDITFASNATLRVGGSPVVRATDLPSIRCANPQTKCTTMVLTSSLAMTDGGAAVVLQTGLATNLGLCTISDPANDLLQSV
jgi:hypothetical protein